MTLEKVLVNAAAFTQVSKLVFQANYTLRLPFYHKIQTTHGESSVRNIEIKSK
jgi:hypothetical protein